MEAKLPLPSQLLCSHLWAKSNEAGLGLSHEDIVLLSRIFCDYVQNTPDGKATTLKLLNLQTRKVDPRHAYHVSRGVSGAPLDAKSLQVISGWLYQNNYTMPQEAVDVEKNGSMEACESTGIMGPKDYCVKIVKDYGPHGEVLVSLSNYARLLSDKPSLRDTANQKICDDCFIKTCPYHPKKEPMQLMLSPPKEMKDVSGNTRNNFF